MYTEVKFSCCFIVTKNTRITLTIWEMYTNYNKNYRVCMQAIVAEMRDVSRLKFIAHSSRASHNLMPVNPCES